MALWITRNNNTFIMEQTNLEMVTQNGNKLQCISDQTEELCLAAVKQNGNALLFVKNQTLKICIAAMIQNEGSFNFVKKELEMDVVNHFISS